MATTFSELVIEGPFMMVKGFLLGFLGCRKPEGKYFFHRKNNIRRDTLREFLKELFELENYVHVCLEDELIEPFQKAIKLYTQKTGYKIKSVKPIKGAEFSFAAEIFDRKMAEEFKNIIKHLPAGVKLDYYFPVEQTDEDAKGIEAYAPLHEYAFRAKGTITGDFGGLIEIFNKIKQSPLGDFVMLSQIRLHF